MPRTRNAGVTRAVRGPHRTARLSPRPPLLDSSTGLTATHDHMKGRAHGRATAQPGSIRRTMGTGMECPRRGGSPGPLRRRRSLHLAHRRTGRPPKPRHGSRQEALRSYWTAALQRNAGLHFTLLDVYAGVDTIVVRYRTQLGALINEVLTFADGLVVVGHATHQVNLHAVRGRAGPCATAH